MYGDDFYYILKQSRKRISFTTKNTQEKIKKKLLDFKNGWSLDIKKMVDFDPATHRFKIADYRLMVIKQWNEYLIIKVWHRREIYK